MQIASLSDITQPYEHIYLSPHLDDAVLSCGGSIIEQRRRGERVLVVTFCTAAPPAEGPFNELAQEFHRFWALPPDQVVGARLREDAEAMQRLGADFLWAGLLDAIYRRPDAYTSRESLFGTPVADDPLLPALAEWIGELRRVAPDAQFYAPLAVGFHVDHQMTYRAALANIPQNLHLYEDVPYATFHYASYAGAVDDRLAAVDLALTPRFVSITDTLDAKIHAIAAYASQLDELFRTATMPEVMTIYHTGLVPGDGADERLWELQA